MCVAQTDISHVIFKFSVTYTVFQLSYTIAIYVIKGTKVVSIMMNIKMWTTIYDMLFSISIIAEM